MTGKDNLKELLAHAEDFDKYSEEELWEMFYNDPEYFRCVIINHNIKVHAEQISHYLKSPPDSLN